MPSLQSQEHFERRCQADRDELGRDIDGRDFYPRVCGEQRDVGIAVVGSVGLPEEGSGW